MRMYEPKPIDTSEIQLSTSIRELLEQLAEHNHEVWAQQRMEDGWTYGPSRDDVAKHHPGLVPFEMLSDLEKQYDRLAASQALKAILSLGYHIDEPKAPIAVADGRPGADLIEEIRNPRTEMARLVGMWRERPPTDSAWQSVPELYCELARRLLAGGLPLQALEVAREGAECWPQNLILRQLHGLALARTGAASQANVVLNDVWIELCRQPSANERDLTETLGALARTCKDLGLRAETAQERRHHLIAACQWYGEAWQRTGDYWNGINLATVATLLGDHQQGMTVSRQVAEKCHRKLNSLPDDHEERYWLFATLGEASLNLQDFSTAKDWYQRAHRVANQRYGDLMSTRQQATLLLRHCDRNPADIDHWLPLPKVAVFSGHMVDRPGRAQARLPANRTELVKNAIKTWLREENVMIGFSSAACGSDILFQEALAELTAERHIVLPYREEQFIPDSVAIVPDGDWERRFHNVLRGAQVVYASEQRLGTGSIAYDYCNLVQHGMSILRARELQTNLVGLAVWNGQKGDGPGGTASIVKQWKRQGLPIYVLGLPFHSDNTLLENRSRLPNSAKDGLQVVLDEQGTFSPRIESDHTDSDTHVMAMLFADVVHYSQLTEDQVPHFVQHFLGAIADVLKDYEQANIFRNTWGDGLYLVFSSVRDAGRFALELRDMINRTDWEAKGLPATLNLRIALHAGPVFGCTDPITGQRNYTGTHVSRAARLEPQTPPGEVYGSEAFAAFAAFENVTEFSCHYVKQLQWAKHYGTFPTYLLRKC